jgi:hypothetical protein
MLAIPEPFAGQFAPDTKLTRVQLADLRRVVALFRKKDPGFVPAWNGFLAHHNLHSKLRPPPNAYRMREACERAMMVLRRPLRDVELDFAECVAGLVALWDHLLPVDHLPAKMRRLGDPDRAEVRRVIRDRAEARRVIGLLLRRLDEIEGRQGKQEPAPQQPKDTHTPAPPPAPNTATRSPGGGAAAPRANEAARKATVNQRMLEIIENNPQALLWTITQWVERLKCGRATVHATAAYKQCQISQEAVRRKEEERHRGWQDYLDRTNDD